MLTKKILENESIEYLQNYLKRLRRRKLTKKEIETINIHIEKQKLDNKKLAEQITNSPLFRLALTKIVLDTRINNLNKLSGSKIIENMYTIVETACNNRKKDLLKEYYDEE